MSGYRITCSRCKTKSPLEKMWEQGWAIPHDLWGYMCPKCFKQWCTIRTRHRSKFIDARDRFMKPRKYQ